MLQQPRAAVSTVVCVLSLEQFGVGTVVSRLIIVAIVADSFAAATAFAVIGLDFIAGTSFIAPPYFFAPARLFKAICGGGGLYYVVKYVLDYRKLSSSSLSTQIHRQEKIQSVL